MNINLNVTLQTIALVVQVLNAIGVFGAEKQIAIAASVATLQAGLAARAQYSNPDGTSAKVGWDKDKKA